MKFLMDTSVKNLERRIVRHDKLIAGQLLTPLTNYKVWDGIYGIDNGAFCNFDELQFKRLLEKNKGARNRCLFVCSPDVVGNARRTLEMFDLYYHKLATWPRALVMQDGVEDLRIPWNLIDAVFIGGTTRFKESAEAVDLVRAGLIAGAHVHVGRINTIRRYRIFERAGAHTCDGSGVNRFDWMLERIEANAIDDNDVLFDKADICHPEPSQHGG